MAGYWASLGLLPEIADQNLANCRVQIQSIDVEGKTELGGALRELGVRHRQEFSRPDGHAGERLSRAATG